jgi:hypothetical protein
VLSQARIHYYWYKKQRALCHMQPVCDMGGFTRLLHTGEADDLMDEIPTVSVPGCCVEGGWVGSSRAGTEDSACST